jgi:hypothetical protein
MTTETFLTRPTLRRIALVALATIFAVLGGMLHAGPSAAANSPFGGLTAHVVAPHSTYQYQLRNYNTANGGNKCLVQHYYQAQGYIFDCNRVWNDQLWHIEESHVYQGIQSYRIINIYNGLCLTIQNHGDRTPAMGYDCTGKDDQDFYDLSYSTFPNEHLFGDVGSHLCLTAQHDTEQSPAFGSSGCTTDQIFTDEMWDMI